MTKKIFWKNPYLDELETIVQTVDYDQITLVETIFYAFSGGQESDEGTISGYKVLKAEKIGKEIFYTIDPNHQLKPKDKVKIIIDWDRRYKLMRLHFAAEIVLELVYKKFPSVIKVGAHIGQDKARIDFQIDQNVSPFLNSFQQEAQNIIDSNQKIISAFSDVKNEQRYWKILEFSKIPCGGTHLKYTKEVGKITLKRVNLGKQKERIEIFTNR